MPEQPLVECDLGYEQDQIPVGGQLVTTVVLTDAEGTTIASTTSIVERPTTDSFVTTTQELGSPDGEWD